MSKYQMQSWDMLAQTDPYWAVLTSDDRRGNRWSEEEFFATGEADVAAIMTRLASLGLVVDRTRALDFGCGLGRLTRALARRFAAVDGVDLSHVMIEKAVAIGPVSNVRFIHNPSEDLSPLDDEAYGLIVSLISIQHMPEKAAAIYVGDMCRVLARGGVAYLQLNTFLSVSDPRAAAKLARDESLLNRVYRSARSVFRKKRLRMDTHYFRLSRLLNILERKRMQLVAVVPDSSVPAPFVSHVVIFRKRDQAPLPAPAGVTPAAASSGPAMESRDAPGGPPPGTAHR